MSQPFSRLPDPGVPRPFKRRLQPQMIQDALRVALQSAGEYAREARRYGEDLWRRGKRHPRAFGIAGAAAAVTVVGAYALNAMGTGNSLCPSGGKATKGKAAGFQVLMDPVPQAAAGSQLEIYYDVCGLSSGTPYRGRLQLTQQQAPSKKKKKKSSAKPKSLVVSFQDKADGVGTRRSQELELGATKPGAYTLELSVTDNRGRERKKVQKLMVKAK
jgi:hypothetical protein